MIEREFDSLARIKSGVRGFEGQHSPEMKSPMEVQASAALRGVGSGLNMTDRVETIAVLRCLRCGKRGGCECQKDEDECNC